jgi:hypothetical protein
MFLDAILHRLVAKIAEDQSISFCQVLLQCIFSIQIPF